MKFIDIIDFRIPITNLTKYEIYLKNMLQKKLPQLLGIYSEMILSGFRHSRMSYS